MYLIYENRSSELAHHGIKGQKWGVRRFQDAAGRLTSAGKQRYGRVRDVMEYATRDKNWASTKYTRYGYGKNPYIKTKKESTSSVIADPIRRSAHALKNNLQDDRVRQFKERAEYATRSKGWGSVNNPRGNIELNGRFQKFTGKSFAYVKPESSVDTALKVLSSRSKDAINSYAKKGRYLYDGLKIDAEHLTRDSGWQRRDQYTPKFSNREYLAFRTMDNGGIDFTNRYYRNNPKYTGKNPAYASAIRRDRFEQYKRSGLSDREATNAVYGSDAVRRFFNGEYERPGDAESRRRNPSYYR